MIAANVLHKVSHADFFPLIHQKFGTESVVISRASLYNRAASQNYAVEKLLEKEYLHFDGQGEAWRLQGYRSVGSLFDDPTCAEQRLRTCFLQVPQYPNKSVEPNETDLSNLVDVEFWSHKQNTSTSRIFGKLNTEVVNDHTGLNLFVNKEARGGNIYRLDFAFRRTAGQQVGSFSFPGLLKFIKSFFSRVSIPTWVTLSPCMECSVCRSTSSL